MTKLSTLEVARKVGIGRATLERWLSNGGLQGPKTIRFGKSEFRDWTAEGRGEDSEYKQHNYPQREMAASRSRSGRKIKRATAQFLQPDRQP